MPRSPAMVSMGSPGTRRMRKKASSVTPMNVGMSRETRVRMNLIMSGQPVIAIRSSKAGQAAPGSSSGPASPPHRLDMGRDHMAGRPVAMLEKIFAGDEFLALGVVPHPTKGPPAQYVAPSHASRSGCSRIGTRRTSERRRVRSKQVREAVALGRHAARSRIRAAQAIRSTPRAGTNLVRHQSFSGSRPVGQMHLPRSAASAAALGTHSATGEVGTWVMRPVRGRRISGGFVRLVASFCARRA